jgi:hypothetical protein
MTGMGKLRCRDLRFAFWFFDLCELSVRRISNRVCSATPHLPLDLCAVRRIRAL